MIPDFYEMSQENRVLIIVGYDGPSIVSTISSRTGINCQYTTSEVVTELAKEELLERNGEFYSLGRNNGN